MIPFERISEIIASVLNIEKSLINESLGVGQIPQWDSMGNMAILAAIEEQLGIEIPLDDLFDLTNVKAIVDEVNKLLK